MQAITAKEIANTEKRIHPNEGGLELPVGIDLKIVPGYLTETVEAYRRGAIAQGNKVFILPPWLTGAIGAVTAQKLKDSAALTPSTPPGAFGNSGPTGNDYEDFETFANDASLPSCLMIGPALPLVIKRR